MAVASVENVHFCRERACKPGSEFSISQRFARPEFRDRLIALQAFMLELGSIPFEVSEPGVAVAKIAWWRQELSTPAVQASLHPIVRALNDTGALEQIGHDLLDEYLIAVLQRASDEPVCAIGELCEYAKQTGGAETRMQFAQGDVSPEPAGLENLGTAIVLNRLISNPYKRFCKSNWWLPLDLQAKHGISFADIETIPGQEKLHQALHEVALICLGLINHGLIEIQSSGASDYNAGIHHLLVNAVVVKRRLSKQITVAGGKPNWRLSAPAEVFTAWRQAIR